MIFFIGSKLWDNIAFNQSAWASYPSSSLPASQAVDGDVMTSGHTGVGSWPFLAIDMASNLPVGMVTLRFVSSK